MSVSVWQANDTQPLREVDVLVVGGGVVGCTAAYFLSQAGRQVVVCEARDLALGASGRNAGFLITGPDTYYHHAIEQHGHAAAREIWAISEQTHRYWRRFAQAGNVPLSECGSLLLAESRAEAKDLALAAQAMAADGLDAEFLSRDPLQRGYFAAVRQPWDAAIQPVALTEAIFAQSGAELVANNEVYGLAQEANGAVLVSSRKFRFRARLVMLCTNAYSPLIDPYFIGKVVPTRGQCLATAPLPNPPLSVCGYSNYGYMYYRSTFDNRLLIGGARHKFKKLEGNTTEDKITAQVQGALEAYLSKRFPDVNAPIERRWAGIMGFSPDGLPLVGRLPHMPNVGFAVGFTGHGLSLGAATAERAVEVLLHGGDAGVISAGRKLVARG
jgi:gamma-glutamylputrescine oxidase